MTSGFLVKFYPILTPHTCLLVKFKVRKVIGGWGGWPVGLQCQPQSHSLSSGLWTLDFQTWNWEMELGLGIGTQDLDLGLTIFTRLFDWMINDEVWEQGEQLSSGNWVWDIQCELSLINRNLQFITIAWDRLTSAGSFVSPGLK